MQESVAAIAAPTRRDGGKSISNVPVARLKRDGPAMGGAAVVRSAGYLPSYQMR